MTTNDYVRGQIEAYLNAANALERDAEKLKLQDIFNGNLSCVAIRLEQHAVRAREAAKKLGLLED
jgi:hypothetical protein